MSLQFSTDFVHRDFTPSVGSQFRPVASALFDAACRLRRALQHRLAAPRRAAEFAAIDDRTLRDIGLNRSMIPLIPRAEP